MRAAFNPNYIIKVGITKIVSKPFHPIKDLAPDGVFGGVDNNPIF
jgi:hypothetical protein